MLVRTFSLLGCWAVCASVCARIGEAHSATHQVAISVYLLFSLLGEAPSIAGQVLIARRTTLGQKSAARRLVRRLVSLSLKVGLFSATATYLAGLAAPRMFALSAGLPGSKEEVLRTLLKSTMRVAALTQPICALTLLAEGLVTGCRAFRYIAFTTTVAGLIISSSLLAFAKGPVTLLGRTLPFFQEGLGVKGVWWHLCVLFMIRFVAAAGKVLHEISGPDWVPDPDLVAEEMIETSPV